MELQNSINKNAIKLFEAEVSQIADDINNSLIQIRELKIELKSNEHVYIQKLKNRIYDIERKVTEKNAQTDVLMTLIKSAKDIMSEDFKKCQLEKPELVCIVCRKEIGTIRVQDTIKNEHNKQLDCYHLLCGNCKSVARWEFIWRNKCPECNQLQNCCTSKLSTDPNFQHTTTKLSAL